MKHVQKRLLEWAERHNTTDFIPDDPIEIPHRFTRKEDIEVAAFFAALFAWGQRTTIRNKTNDLLNRMDNDPFAFVMHASNEDLNVFNGFVHRTFNQHDVVDLLLALRATHSETKDWSLLFVPREDEINYGPAISRFRARMLQHVSNPKRVSRFLSDPIKGSAAKRLVMFLRWMVRRDNAGVDFGIWAQLPMHKLSCPLDVHTARTARHLKLISRKQNDWKTVEELDAALRKIDPNDPARFDFALFSMSVEGFSE
ncbi:MAG: TIGR02757 family protein [Cryomorphaceae bacterium]|nr:TIGR02757 family protein [Cryomorphaceae bacterium]